jgi:hypothetical protein
MERKEKKERSEIEIWRKWMSLENEMREYILYDLKWERVGIQFWISKFK